MDNIQDCIIISELCQGVIDNLDSHWQKLDTVLNLAGGGAQVQNCRCNLDMARSRIGQKGFKASTTGLCKSTTRLEGYR